MARFPRDYLVWNAIFPAKSCYSAGSLLISCYNGPLLIHCPPLLFAFGLISPHHLAIGLGSWWLLSHTWSARRRGTSTHVVTIKSQRERPCEHRCIVTSLLKTKEARSTHVITIEAVLPWGRHLTAWCRDHRRWGSYPRLATTQRSFK